MSVSVIKPWVRVRSHGTERKKSGVQGVYDLSLPSSDITGEVSRTPVCSSRKWVTFLRAKYPLFV